MGTGKLVEILATYTEVYAQGKIKIEYLGDQTFHEMAPIVLCK